MTKNVKQVLSDADFYANRLDEFFARAENQIAISWFSHYSTYYVRRSIYLALYNQIKRQSEYFDDLLRASLDTPGLSPEHYEKLVSVGEKSYIELMISQNFSNKPNPLNLENLPCGCFQPPCTFPKFEPITDVERQEAIFKYWNHCSTANLNTDVKDMMIDSQPLDQLLLTKSMYKHSIFNNMDYDPERGLDHFLNTQKETGSGLYVYNKKQGQLELHCFRHCAKARGSFRTKMTERTWSQLQKLNEIKSRTHLPIASGFLTMVFAYLLMPREVAVATQLPAVSQRFFSVMGYSAIVALLQFGGVAGLAYLLPPVRP